MNNVILTQLSLEELRQMLREEVNVLLLQMTNSVPDSSYKELLTLAEASLYLKLARATVYNLVHRREIPYMKRGKRLYFAKDELHAWVAEGRKSTQRELNEIANVHLKQLKDAYNARHPF